MRTRFDVIRDLRAAKERRNELAKLAEPLATRAGNLVGDDLTLWDRSMVQIDSVNADIERLEGELVGAPDRGAGFSVVSSRAVDSLLEDAERSGGVERSASRDFYVDAAMRSIDGWGEFITAEWRESAERAVKGDRFSRSGRGVAAHIAAYGTPEYGDAFYSFLRGGVASLNHDQIVAMRAANERSHYDFEGDIERAMNEGSTAAGGAIVPPYLDPAIVLTNAGINNPFRQIASVKTISTQVWKGVTSAGVTAEWTAESSEMTDASPTVANKSITPIRADCSVQASWELLEDTQLGAELAMLFADAKDILEGTAFATGTGSTQPTGVVTALDLVTNSRTSANTSGVIGAVDVFNTSSNLAARWQPRASWLSHRKIQNLLRALATGPSQAQSAFWADFGQALPSKLVGYDIYLSSAMSSTQTTGQDVLILGDFTQYNVVDRVGMQVQSAPVIGANRRLTGETIFGAFFRTGGDVMVPSAFQMLRL